MEEPAVSIFIQINLPWRRKHQVPPKHQYLHISTVTKRYIWNSYQSKDVSSIIEYCGISVCNNTHQLVIMITGTCTNDSSVYNLTPKSTYACSPSVFHLFLSVVVNFYWCQSLNVNFIHFTKNIGTNSQREFFINKPRYYS